ncbi:MAG: carbohydrate kinase family protein [Hyphomicrobiaceae bacterium]|nr:carbohydrate kinase family protein [Hyphomicrobiaceae bacterium]
MKALCIGGAMIDTIAIVDSDRIERMTMTNADKDFLLIEEGRKVEAHEISTHVGGGAVNAAVCMARQGVDVATLVKVGQDARAETVFNLLLAERVSTRWVMRDQRAPTGASVMLSSHDRNAAIFTFRGANTLLEPSDLKAEAFAVDLVYVASLSNESADAFPAIVAEARRAGALVATNPGVRQLASRGGAMQEQLKDIDVLAINAAEAGTMVPALVARFGEARPSSPAPASSGGLPRLVQRGFSSGTHDMAFASFFAALRRLGTRYTVVTDGRHGAFVGTDDAILHCPGLAAQVAGTAGAGDAFNATFAVQLAGGAAPGDALRAAVVNAASVVGFVDTQTGLLAGDELARRVRDLTPSLPLSEWRQAV